MFDFKPGATLESQICITPDNEPHLVVEMHPDPPIDQYIEIERQPIVVSSSLCVPFSITFPKEYNVSDPFNTLYKPGENRYKIKAYEMAPAGGGTISAIKVLSHNVVVILPYPGKYLEASLSAVSANAGMPVMFHTTLKHKGTSLINKVTGSIAIYDADGQQQGVIPLQAQQSIQPDAVLDMDSNWPTTGHPAGKYSANLTVDYDGKHAFANTLFQIGTLDFDIVHSTPNVTILGIQPYELTVENLWGEEVADVRAAVTIQDESRTEQESFETVTREVEAFKTAVLKGYFNTEAFQPGEKQVQILLYFQNESKQFQRSVVILSPMDDEEEGLHLETTTILIGAIVLLLLILAAVVLYEFVYKRRKKS